MGGEKEGETIITVFMSRYSVLLRANYKRGDMVGDEGRVFSWKRGGLREERVERGVGDMVQTQLVSNILKIHISLVNLVPKSSTIYADFQKSYS